MPLKISPEVFNIGLSLKYENLVKEHFSDYHIQKFSRNGSYDLKKTITTIKEIGYDFVSVPINQETAEIRHINKIDNLLCNLRYLDHYTIHGHEWNMGIIGTFFLNEYTGDQVINILEWCAYVGYHAILIPIKKLSIKFVSSLLSFIVSVNNGIQIWVELTLEANIIDQEWTNWQFIQRIMDNGISTSKIGLVLSIIASQSNDIKFSDLERFLGEPIKCVVVNYHLLDKEVRQEFKNGISEFILKLLRLKVPLSIRFEDNERINKDYLNKVYNNVTNYMKNLVPLSEQEKYEYNYIDILQVPLQPLKVNLESIYYEIFERDPVKYEKYQEAITLCLLEIFEKTPQINILVVGAGRGALIKCSINALKKLNISSFAITCLEKNLNAVISLNAHGIFEQDEYWRKVKIIHSDVRDVELDEKFDIIISELLGSFGDNELSPECLYSAQKFLNDKGVMIPQCYTSFIEPISCKKVWNNARKLSSSKTLETPFVVKLKSAYHFSVEGPKKVFSFRHPIKKQGFPDERKNAMFSCINFTSKQESILHGFLGYFKCKLYRDIGFSTVPNEFSEGLISWFEFFIPLSDPIAVSKNDKITLNIWRKFDKNKVWYEWLVTSPSVTFIHNSNGIRFYINL